MANDPTAKRAGCYRKSLARDLETPEGILCTRLCRLPGQENPERATGFLYAVVFGDTRPTPDIRDPERTAMTLEEIYDIAQESWYSFSLYNDLPFRYI